MKYIFGVYTAGGIRYGSTPLVKHEEHEVKTIERDGNDHVSKARTDKPGDYAYAWNLAAVISPDYVDMGNPGFDSEDYGQFLGIEYRVGNPNYWSSTPWTFDPAELKAEFNFQHLMMLPDEYRLFGV